MVISTIPVDLNCQPMPVGFTEYQPLSHSSHFPLTSGSGWVGLTVVLLCFTLQAVKHIVIISLLPDGSATEKSMDNENLEGYWAIRQGKIAYLMTH